MQKNRKQGSTFIPVMALRAAVSGERKYRHALLTWMSKHQTRPTKRAALGSAVGVPRELETNVSPQPLRALDR